MGVPDDIAAKIREVLRLPDLDVHGAAASGDITIAPQVPTGFRAIGQLGNGQSVGMSGALWYKLCAYRDELDIVETAIASGLTDFHHILTRLRQSASRTGLSGNKAAQMRTPDVAGREMFARPHMGVNIPMLRDVSFQFHHLVIQNTFRAHVTDEIDTVFDAGCGTGDILAELVSSDPGTRIKYFGGEIAANGRTCLEKLAGVMRKPNVKAVPFDIWNPDFSFLGDTKRLLFLANFALVYANPFPSDFWLKLFAAVPDIHVVMFEPLSFAMPDLAPKPLFTRERAKAYNIAENLYAVIQDLAQKGLIRIEEIVPDMTGLTIYSPVTLLRFRTLAKS